MLVRRECVVKPCFSEKHSFMLVNENTSLWFRIVMIMIKPSGMSWQKDCSSIHLFPFSPSCGPAALWCNRWTREFSLTGSSQCQRVKERKKIRNIACIHYQSKVWTHIQCFFFIFNTFCISEDIQTMQEQTKSVNQSRTCFIFFCSHLLLWQLFTHLWLCLQLHEVITEVLSSCWQFSLESVVHLILNHLSWG